MRYLCTLLFLFSIPASAFAQSSTPGGDLARAVNAPVTIYTRNEKAVETAAAFEERLSPFYHGVASGDPLTDRVIIWTRVTPESEQSVDVFWRVSTDVELKQIVQQGSLTTDQSRDYTVKVDVHGLQPGTTYYYGFTALGKNSLTGRTKTAPVTTDRLRFAVVSCSNYQAGFFNAYGRIADRNDLDAVVHLGDYIYEYPHGGYGYNPTVGRGHEPKNEAFTRSDYRIRYSFYKLDPDLRRIHQQHPFISVWDDHETANNSYKDGASNHQPGTEGDWQIRKSAARQAYHEWMPVREQSEKVYRVLRYGDLADLIIIDSRLEGRMAQLDSITNPAYNDPNRTMLGATQREWLLDQLKRSTARWKIIGNQTMIVQLRALEPLMDQWDGYPAERARILDFLKTDQLDNVIVATGDIHTSWANDISIDPYATATYDPATGSGSLGVEFITPSITAANFNESTTQSSETAQGLLKLLNPHVKYIELDDHGYYLLDLTQERAQADWYHVDTILIRSDGERFAQGARVADNANRVVLIDSPVPSRVEAPAPAPEDPPAEIPSSVDVGQTPDDGVMIVGSYPNPAVTYTSLHYAISRPLTMSIKVFTSEGKYLKTLIEGDQQPGIYSLPVSTDGLAAGGYMFVVETEVGSSARTFVVRK